jgi:hypothetical protein
MLRVLIVALIVANAGYFAWRQGWLGSLVASSPQGERDPYRVDRQVDPQSVVFVPAAAASQAAASARDLPSCIEAGPFDTAQVEAAEAALVSLVPAGSWTRVATPEPSTWAVYMGRYIDTESLQRKQAELRRLRVSYETLRDTPDWSPGLVLARHASKAAAEEALADYTRRGVRTSRVVELAGGRPLYLLRSDGGDALLVQQLLAVRSAAVGRGFSACAKTTGG